VGVVGKIGTFGGGKRTTEVTKHWIRDRCVSHIILYQVSVGFKNRVHMTAGAVKWEWP